MNSRLPSKVLLPQRGKTAVIEGIIARAQAIPEIDAVICAMPSANYDYDEIRRLVASRICAMPFRPRMRI